MTPRSVTPEMCALHKKIQDLASAKEYINEALSIAMHAIIIRAAIHSTLGISSRRHTFNRDRSLNTPLISDWHTITQRQEHLINKNHIRENQTHHQYNYVPQTKGTKEKMENLHVRWKNQWTIQGCTDTCNWYFRVKTRCLRETQHKKGYTIQRAHSHIITDVQTTG